MFGVARGTWALKTAMIVHHAVVGPLAILAIFEDPTLREVLLLQGGEGAARRMLRDEVAGPSQAAIALVPITVGYMAADLLLISQWSLAGKGSNMENMLMILHHVLSMIAWPPTLMWDFCSRYVIILLSYELSSVFLTLNWQLSVAGWKKSPLYFASGLLFTGSFVLMRLVGAVPQLLSLFRASPWFSHLQGVPGWAVPLSSMVILPHILNFFWGIKVIRGFAKVVLGTKETTKGLSEQEALLGAGSHRPTKTLMKAKAS